jgi:hypothetical protein
MKVLNTSVVLTVIGAAFAAATGTPGYAAEPWQPAMQTATILPVAMPAPDAADATVAMRALLTDPDFRRSATLPENAWDFDRPETIPGFGPIRPSDYALLAASYPASDE